MNAGPLKIVLIGTSVRPLIASCLRANCVPVAFDFFADWDGQQLIRGSGGVGASLTKIDSYADLLEYDLAKLGDGVVLAGGAELRADLVRSLGRQLSVLGTDAESLAAMADSVNWLSALQDAGCRVPETSSQLPEDATGWLLKRGGTCGGSGVWLAEGEIAKNVAAGSVGECYYQQRIAGQSLSAVLVSRRPTEREASVTFLLGCTRQWLASDFSGGTETLDGSGDRPFAYCGSAGPVLMPEPVRQQIERIATVLAERFTLRGVWGLDFILDADGQVWPVDLNPRITASAELFEASVSRSSSKFRSVFDVHLAACRLDSSKAVSEFEQLFSGPVTALASWDYEAKRIVFFDGPGAVVIDETKFEQLMRLHTPTFFQSNQTGTSIADVPQVGDRIEAGRPLLTIRSRAGDEVAARALLDALLGRVQACLLR